MTYNDFFSHPSSYCILNWKNFLTISSQTRSLYTISHLDFNIYWLLLSICAHSIGTWHANSSASPLFHSFVKLQAQKTNAMIIYLSPHCCSGHVSFSFHKLAIHTWSYETTFMLVLLTSGGNLWGICWVGCQERTGGMLFLSPIDSNLFSL